jgi:hypothetical protein
MNHDVICYIKHTTELRASNNSQKVGSRCWYRNNIIL